MISFVSNADWIDHAELSLFSAAFSSIHVPS